MRSFEYKCDKCGEMVIWPWETIVYKGETPPDSFVEPHSCGGILRRIYNTFGIVVR